MPRIPGAIVMKLDDLLRTWSEDLDGGPVAVALHREWANPEVVAHFTIIGEPQSKSRARVTSRNGKVHAYTPRQTELAEDAVAWQFKAAGGRGPDGAKTFGVFAVFLCGTRQRRDVDNMLKLILDGLNKIAWADDSQVTEVSGRLTRGVPKDEARTEVIVYETVTAMAGGLQATKPCEHCGTPIRIYPSTSGIRFCSGTCAGQAKRIHPDVACAGCGRTFTPNSGARTTCSRECDRGVRTTTRSCAHCGATITSPRSWDRKFCGRACFNAWGKGKPRGTRA